MNDKQHGFALTPYPDCSNRVPTLLATLVGSVRINQTSLVVENQSCIFEWDPVLAPILAILPLILFVAQPVYTKCSTRLLERQPQPTREHSPRLVLSDW